MWLLKCRQCWHIARLVHELLFTVIHREIEVLCYCCLWRRSSRHHSSVQISLLNGIKLGTLYSLVRACRFTRLRGVVRWRMGHCVGPERHYPFVWLWFLGYQPQLTTSQSRSPLHHLRLSGDDIKGQNTLSTCCQWWHGCSRICLGVDNCRNYQFGRPVLSVFLMEVVHLVPLSRLHQFVNPHLLLLKSLHVLLYCFGDCAIYPARFIIFAQVARLCICFIICVIFPILLIVRTCKFAQTVSASIQHLPKYFSLPVVV